MRKIEKVMLIVFLVISVLCGKYLLDYWQDSYDNRQNYRQVEEIAFPERNTEDAFIVCTHTGNRHIHNHIYWNSTSLDCTWKFRNFWGSSVAVRRLSDLICVEHQMSIVENPKPHGMSYNCWQGAKRDSPTVTGYVWT